MASAAVVAPVVDSWFAFQSGEKINALPDSHEFASQAKQVKAILAAERLINTDRINEEVDWFYSRLGMDRYYFLTNKPEDIAKHIQSLYAAKTLSHTNATELDLQLHNSGRGRAVFVTKSTPGSRIAASQKIEWLIEEKYLGEGFVNTAASTPAAYQQQMAAAGKKEEDPSRYRVQCYRTSGTISPHSDIHLRMYFLSEPKWHPQHKKSPSMTNLLGADAAPNAVPDINEIADQDFLESASDNQRKIAFDIVHDAGTRLGPVIRLFPSTTNPNEQQLVVAYRRGTTHSFFSGVTDLYHSYGHMCSRKYIEQFSNGITMFSIYLIPIKPESTLTETTKNQLIEDANLIYLLPRTHISSLFRDGRLSAKEHAYAYAAWKFAYHFLSRNTTEFTELALALKSNPVQSHLLQQIKNLVKKEAYTEARLAEAILSYPHIVKDLYAEFERFHSPATRVRPDPSKDNTELLLKVKKSVPNELDQMVFRAFLTFNKHILKTNFYKNSKIALSFRLDPRFLPEEEYPKRAYGLFFLVGAEFRGFHVRFRDIARGGIRVIRSPNTQAWVHNATTLFDENYNLAHTQERKNKDIPEGGSKGTILLSVEHSNKPKTAFRKYVDSLLDLLITDEAIVDHYGKEEILFLGPDEGTADFMNWASSHARERAYKFWKAFSTGKSPERGGIPHDTYGMTTRGIHEYVVGLLEKVGVKEELVTKVQTGGPDGDLGSNEIRISKDKTVAVVDGSGVIYDPEGLERTELNRCAEHRKMVRTFDKKKLSARGFFVDVDQNDVTLPDGSVVPSGMDFRNNFHLHPLFKADLFVPCGGRPEAVNASNVAQYIDKETKRPRFRWVVEGANLFFTQEARLFLEKEGVVVFKDASANKGGVTSSSLEVLAALTLNDEQFNEHMTVKDASNPPAFYQEYIKEVHRIIEENARLEFNCLWNENQRTKMPISVLSDTLSNKINELSMAIENSDLWNNEKLRSNVLTGATPKNLLSLLGLETILKRLPEAYARAIFGCVLSSRYVYECGLSATPEFSFFKFIQTYTK